MMASYLGLMVWGLQDALAPLPLAILAFFGAVCLALSPERKVLFRFASLFLFIFFTLSLSTQVGLLSFLLLSPVFQEISRWFFILLGAGLVAIGARFFLAWMSMKNDPSVKDCQISSVLLLLARWMKGPVIIILAIVTSLALMIWPPNAIITLIMSDALLPGKLWNAVWMITVYQFFKTAFMLLVVPMAVFMTGQRKTEGREMLSRSMVFILISGFYFAVGLSVIYVSFNLLF